MTENNFYKTSIVEAFKLLPKKDRDRLWYHYKKKTPILCGNDSLLFTDGKGGA